MIEMFEIIKKKFWYFLIDLMKRNYNVLTCKMSLFINTMLEFYFSTNVAFAHLSNLEVLFESYY